MTESPQFYHGVLLVMAFVLAGLAIKAAALSHAKREAQHEVFRLRRRLKEWQKDEYLRGHRDCLEALRDKMVAAGAPKEWIDAHERAIEFADQHLPGMKRDQTGCK